MDLFFKKIQNLTQFTQPSFKMNERHVIDLTQKPDTFEKSVQNTSPASASKRKKHSTAQGDVLKDLDNVTCPYSGVKLISQEKMDKIERKMEKYPDMQDRIKILDHHKNSMQDLELEMYEIFKDYTQKNPDGNFDKCLQKMEEDCLIRLKLEELKILDKIDILTNDINPKTALDVRKITSNARHIIVNDESNQIFKRKDILKQLVNVTQNEAELEIIQRMWKTADELPKSSTNKNAFVVKYAHRDPKEIASRLLRPSVSSIEHIHPASLDGENSMNNFMLCARDWNSNRGNIPLNEFIENHKNIPRFCQFYVDDIINNIHSKKLLNYNWYPYMLKERLYNESKGKININLDEYKITEEQAFTEISQENLKIYNNLKNENNIIRTNKKCSASSIIPE